MVSIYTINKFLLYLAVKEEAVFPVLDLRATMAGD